MARTYKPVSEDQKRQSWLKKMHVHRHNGFKGFVSMMYQQLTNIISSDCATEETKAIAKNMLPHLRELNESLKYRQDGPDKVLVGRRRESSLDS